MFFLNAIASILLHELTHIAAAVGLKVRIKKVGLSWKGPYIKRESGTQRKNLAISLAAPCMNLALAWFTRHIDANFALNNLVLGAFNLIPIPSSDGHRALCLLRDMYRSSRLRSRASLDQSHRLATQALEGTTESQDCISENTTVRGYEAA